MTMCQMANYQHQIFQLPEKNVPFKRPDCVVTYSGIAKVQNKTVGQLF